MPHIVWIPYTEILAPSCFLFSHISETFYFSLFDIKHVLLLAFDIGGCLRFSDFDITAALFGNNADGGDSGFGELLGTNIMIKKD